MEQRYTGRGADLPAALADALAQVADVATTAVKVSVSLPGGSDIQGSLLLELQIEDAPIIEEVSSAVEDEPFELQEQRAEQADPRVDATREPEIDVDHRPTAAELDEEADAAADFLEGLLDALDLPGDLRIKVHEDHAEIEIVEIGSGALIGRRGQTLEAIQELVRCTLQREFQRRSRIKIDAEGYRARRMEKLIEKAEEAIDDVLDRGEPVRLEPMDVFERKAIHRIVADVEGITSQSQGREPARRIVLSLE